MTGILRHDLALNFILAGKAFLTFVNTNTQNRFTYKVVKHKKSDIYYVNVLTGPDIYTYVGLITSENRFRHSPKSHVGADAQSVKVFDWVLKRILTIVSPATDTEPAKTALPEFIEIYHSGRCGKCGKRLTVPTSIDTGFGPECIKMVMNKQLERDIKLNKLLKLI